MPAAPEKPRPPRRPGVKVHPVTGRAGSDLPLRVER
jgi:hypothetical protein